MYLKRKTELGEQITASIAGDDGNETHVPVYNHIDLDVLKRICQ